MHRIIFQILTNHDRYSFFKFIFEIYFITERLLVFKESVKHLISTRRFTLSKLFVIFYKFVIYWILCFIWLIYVENNNGQGFKVLSVSFKAFSPKTATNKFTFSKKKFLLHVTYCTLCYSRKYPYHSHRFFNLNPPSQLKILF